MRLQVGWKGNPGWWAVKPVIFNRRNGRRPGHQRRSWSQKWRPQRMSATQRTRKTTWNRYGTTAQSGDRGRSGACDTACMINLIDDAFSVELWLEPDGGRCLELAQSLSSAQVPAMGKTAEREGPMWLRKKVTDWPPQRDALGFKLQTGRITLSLPDRTIGELWELLLE